MSDKLNDGFADSDVYSEKKKPCPFKEKCYRKNPVHFNEMSHPHLEKLIKQLDEPIILPNDVGFECSDKTQLMDQLKVLQMVLRKNRKTNDESQPSNLTDAKSDEDKLKINSSSSSVNSSDTCYSSDCSSSKKSCFDYYAMSSDRAKRLKVRDATMCKIIQNGHKLPKYTPGKFALKLALSAPYYYFLNVVEDEEKTHEEKLSISFTELLDISLGEITDSLHINFMVEIGWLCLQYLIAAQNPKMTIFYGSICDPQTSTLDCVKTFEVPMPFTYGCHHSKISIFKYNDNGIRIIVSTANIYSDDWMNRTQGIWISPHLRRMPDSASSSQGDSPTNFKKDFIEYLASYKHPQMAQWECLVKRADFSDVNVFFVASVPGSHKGINLNSWGHRKLSTILSKHTVLPPNGPQWKLIAQCSSIGSLGPSYESWVLSNIVESMSKEKTQEIKSNPNFNFIYPSLKNYEESFDCKSGTCCLPYTETSHKKQEWLQNYLCKWKAEKNSRTKAMPHIKTYTRISPDCTEIPWFVLTSANLSKGAWGTTAKKGLSHFIMNYEAGVVFMPKLIIGQSTFPIASSNSPEVPIFPLPYDLPLIRYRSNDTPFRVDFLSNV